MTVLGWPRWLDPRRHYAEDGIPPTVRFDLHETTISHLLRAPHPALGGHTYAQALGDAARREGARLAHGVIEIGGGRGDVAKGLVAETDQYLSIDLSPVLIESQRLALGSRFRGVRGDAMALPLRDGVARGFVIANEVLADLPVCRADDQRLQPYAAFCSAGPVATGLRNLGALTLIKEIARVLGPGGVAVLTEYGGDEVRGVELSGPGGGHVEHTVRFEHLLALSRAYGLDAKVVPLVSWLNIDRSIRVASTRDLRFARLAAPGLPLIAYTEGALRDRLPAWIRWFPFELPTIASDRWPDPHVGIGFARAFFALILKRG